MARRLSDIPVGGVVQLRENDALVDFIVLGRENPSAAYVGFNGGTILVRRDVLPNRAWRGSGTGVEYNTSGVHAFLNGEYLDLIPQNIRNVAHQVRVPFSTRPDTQNPWVVQSGNNGLLCRAFLLSGVELGFPEGTVAPDNGILPANEGVHFSFFNSNARRQATRNGAGANWWTRTPTINISWAVITLNAGGGISWQQPTNLSAGPRPCLVLPNTLWVDGNNEVQTNLPPTIPPSITIPATIMGSVGFAISWQASTSPQNNLNGYRVERQLNSGAWTQIFQANVLSTTDTVPFGTNTVAYRVRATDSFGDMSGWQTSPTRTVVNNRPPGAPPTITVPLNIVGGSNTTITWGVALDPDGDPVTYELEHSTDGGTTFTQIFSGAALSFTDAITFGWVTVIYRVRAVDPHNASSDWRVSPTRTVDNTVPPTITTSAPSNLGLQSADFAWQYVVDQADGEVTTVVEAINGIQIRSYTATLGDTQTFDVSGIRFMTILNGAVTMTVTATGSSGKSATLTVIAEKGVYSMSITLNNPLPAYELITRMVMNFVGFIPSDVDFQILVTNNANDHSPVWEDITNAVTLGINHLFDNTTAANGDAFNFIITASRGASNTGGFIATIGGAFE